jgi:hypothetical protein
VEKWERWHPRGAEDIGEVIATLHEVEAKEGILSVEIELASRVLRLQFRRVLAYRTHLEECVPEVWAKLHSPSPVKWSFWEVLNSAWITERQATGGLALYPRARHFAVVTEQNLIEVLTQDEPAVAL